MARFFPFGRDLHRLGSFLFEPFGVMGQVLRHDPWRSDGLLGREAGEVASPVPKKLYFSDILGFTPHGFLQVFQNLVVRSVMRERSRREVRALASLPSLEGEVGV